MRTWTHALAFLCLLTLNVPADEKPQIDGAKAGAWTMDFDAAKKEAASKKLPLLLNFTGSDWCGWCKLMEKQVFSQQAWQTYVASNLVLVWVDFPKDQSLVPQKYVARNKALSEQFGVEGFPTYILLDDDGKTQLGQLGADRNITPEAFISQIKEKLQARASVVDALLKTLPAATGEEYRANATRLEKSRAELKELEASFEKKSQALREAIESADKRLAAIRTDARLTALPREKADLYRATQKKLDAAQAEFKAWLETSPARNEENQKKHANWRTQISAFETELRQLLGD